MNNKIYFLLWLIVLFLVTPFDTSAYNLGIDVSKYGYVTYSYPSVLGDEDKEDEKKEENKEEKKEEKREEKNEVKETPKVEKPEKIEIKKEENKTRVTLKKREKAEQKLTPEKVSLKFSASPRASEVGVSHRDDNATEALNERTERKDEKIEIQSEVHDDGTVEMQIESRTVKAKIKNSEIELDVKNNNVGATDSEGNKIELVHLPDQAMEKFKDLGVSTTPDTLEVGQSGDGFEYTVDAVKIEKLFGLIPREVKFKLSLNDSTGTVEQKLFANNLVDQILNIFSF